MKPANSGTAGEVKTVYFLIDTLEVGGTERSLLDLTSRFKNIRPVVVHLFDGAALKPQFERAGITVISMGLRSRYQVLHCISQVRTFLKAEDARLVVAHLFWTEFYCRIAAIGLPTTVIGTFVNDSYNRSRYEKATGVMRAKLKLFQWLDRITSNRCAYFLANSNSIAKSNAVALNIDREKIKVIYRGRDLGKFRHVADRPEGLMFVNVGRLIERKGHIELIKAFSRFVKSHPQASLKIAGDGYNKAALESLISDLGMSSHILLLGNVSDIPKLLQQSDYFVFSSHYEGFSGAVVEAMLSGLPIIASDIEMTREAIEDGIDGILYPVGNEEALLEALERIIRLDAGLLARNARYKATRLFDIEKVALQTESFLQELYPNN